MSPSDDTYSDMALGRVLELSVRWLMLTDSLTMQIRIP